MCIKKIYRCNGRVSKLFCNFASAMQRYFIYLSYDGTNYHGWQIQPNGNSVQEELEKALSLLLRTKTEIVGAGRTDAGVHARLMVAHFDYEVGTTMEGQAAKDIDCPQLCYKLNRLLPRDISIRKIIPVAQDMHARFSAVARTYHYYIHTGKMPFERHYSYQMPYALDFDAMREGCELLKRQTDFAAFCKAGADNKSTCCTVTEARWVKTSPGTWYFEITANRFLRNMVRAVVGTLVDLGRHKITLEQFRHIVEAGRRSDAGESMPGHALFLERVEYPFTNDTNN